MLTVSHKYTCYLASSFNATAELTLRGMILGSINSEELKIRTMLSIIHPLMNLLYLAKLLNLAVYCLKSVTGRYNCP